MNPLNIQAHHFAGGVYCKEMRVQENFEIMQHKHNYDHLSVLAEGCAVVEYEDGDVQTYFSPAVIEIKAGKNHKITAISDILWLCIHATDETDETKVDEVLIQKPELTMIDTGLEIDTSKLIETLDATPEIWNTITLRTENPQSPHYGCDDIWIRFNSLENLDPSNLAALLEPHESVWYQTPVTELVCDVVNQLKRQLPDFELGAIFITRIPAGGKVLRHNDAGSWHPEYYTHKYLISLRADEKQAFCFDGERHITQVGKIYQFNNLIPHWVDNDSDKERISLIIVTRPK
jgi:quercetin dioxygenase-like cupin family protein